MTVKIQIRRGSSLNWTANGTVVLAAGEPGFETDTGKFKVGDGIKQWNTLPYAGGLESLRLQDLVDVSSASPSVNQVLKWNGATWVPATEASSGGTVTSVSGTGTVNGLTLTGTITTSGSLTLGGTLSGNFGTETITTTAQKNKIRFHWDTLVSLNNDVDPTIYHGMIAHVHDQGRLYFAHGGSWVPVANQSEIGGGGGAVNINDLSDVDITSPSIGQVLKWNGTSWINDTDATGGGGGGGGSGTVTSVSITAANGFAGSVATSTSTPAITISTSITGILKGNGTAISAATAGTDYQAPLSLTTTGNSGAATLVGNTLNIPVYTGGGGGGSTSLDGLTDVVVTSPSVGQVIKYNGTAWVNDTDATGGGSGLTSRRTSNVTTNSLANNASENRTITSAAKSYALLKIQTSAAAWVRLYTDTSSRTADEARLEGEDPLAGSGVIAEVITTGSQTVLLAPAVIGWNNASPPVAEIPVRITNKSGSTTTITVTVTLVDLEA